MHIILWYGLPDTPFDRPTEGYSHEFFDFGHANFDQYDFCILH